MGEPLPGRPVMHGALRQLAIVVVIAAVTHAIGTLFVTTRRPDQPVG